MQGYLITFLSFAFVTIIIGKLYILAWEGIYGQELTPAGFGVFLPIMLLILSILNPSIFSNYVSKFLIISFAGLIYLFDDLKGLNRLRRILIAFLFGVILFLVEVAIGNYTNLYIFALIVLHTQ